MGKPVTCEELEWALDTMALVIEQLGDKYWPIYDVLEAELNLRKSRAEKLKFHRERRQMREKASRIKE